MFGTETESRDDALASKRDGGIGNDKARLKRWITVCNDERTCRRVRRRGRASGSLVDASGGRDGWESLREALGDAGWLPCLVRAGDEGASTGGYAASKPSGTNPRIASSRTPRDESESASDSASPRSNSTSYVSRELVRRMSSVRFVRVVERRAVWAARAEIWVCVCVAMDERVGLGFRVVVGRVSLR